MYRLCVMEDVKRWVGDRAKEDITDAYGVLSENKIGKRMVDFCAKDVVYE